ncbi:hypothetical protein KJA13_00985 [Patescibacteria group bacterium]|nr:hypothetical protein [Patescibacteria group bacterium]
MKFAIKNTGENTINLMRKIGYLFQKENQFVRPLGRSGYPRFHLYIEENNDELILNLHLDQKKPVYKGSPAHAGEYEGKVVETEAQRIKQILR